MSLLIRSLLITLVACIAGPVVASQGPMLLADDTVTPHVSVVWNRADGSEKALEADLPWSSPDERDAIDENLEAFVALGGSRLEKGAGHPGGAIVRVGIYKVDRDLMMFEDIANGSDVVIRMSNVRFNQPVAIDHDTLVQRLQYKAEDVVACGLTINQTEMFNVVSHDDDMGGTILPEQVRFSCLGGGDSNGGEASIWIEDDGTLSLRAVIPYRLLRHKGDPWALEIPGSFFEPFHFDLEFEVLPYDVGVAEGIVEEADEGSRAE